MTVIPEGMPRLSTGRHEHPENGTCVMEYINLLTSEPVFNDRPSCTDATVRRAAWNSNDNMTDEGRQRLLALVPRLMACSPVAPLNIVLWDEYQRIETKIWGAYLAARDRTLVDAADPYTPEASDDACYNGLVAALDKADELRPQYAHLWVGVNAEPAPKVEALVK